MIGELINDWIDDNPLKFCALVTVGMLLLGVVLGVWLEAENNYFGDSKTCPVLENLGDTNTSAQFVPPSVDCAECLPRCFRVYQMSREFARDVKLQEGLK